MLRKSIQLIHLLPIYWAVSGLFIINSGDKILVALIIASILVKLISCIFDENEHISLRDNYMIGVVFICAIYASFSYYHNGYSSSEIRVLISTALYSVISLPKKIRYKSLIYIITLSSSYILYQTISIIEIQNLSRMKLPLNAIPYANYTGLLSIITLYLSYSSNNKQLSILSILSFIFLSVNVILVDTRGTWLALISSYISIIFIIFVRKRSLKLTIISLSLLVSIALLSYPFIENSIERSIKEVELLKEGNLDSSWGIRVQLWKAGYSIINDTPSMLGLGQTEHLNLIQKMYREGKLSNRIAWFDNKNFHNSIIDRTVKYGFLGLMLYIGVILTPFIYGIRNLKSNYSPLLIIMPIFIFVAGLSYVPLAHPGTYFLYLLTSIFLINKIRHDRTYK
ncbi:O-antigen ligase family protein [Vibrio campbellii]